MSSFGNLGGLSGNVSLMPRFVFGINGAMRSNIHLIDDDKKILYVAGHNIIIYTLDEDERS